MNETATFKRIVVGTDFSRAATSAVMRAAMLAAEHGAKLRIVHVASPLDVPILRRLGRDRLDRQRPAVDLHRKLDEAVALARSCDIDATIQLAKGGPASRLTHEARRFDADLVVIGARRQSELKDALIGTTVERLMERWTAGILVVKKEPQAPYETVLICAALGPTSRAVVKSAVSLSDRARMHLLHAYEPPFEATLRSYDVSQETIECHRVATRREVAEEASALLDRCAVSAGRRPEIVLRQGRPQTAISMAAGLLQPDVIVMGRKRSILAQLLMGSATRQVLRIAPFDILVSATH